MRDYSNTAVHQALAKIDQYELAAYYADHTRSETCSHFSISGPTLRAFLEYYNIKKSREQKRQTLEKSYGSLQAFYDMKNEIATATKVAKYGSIENFEAAKSKAIQAAILDKYGTKEAYVKYQAERQKQACLDKYGVENISQLEFVKQKKADTMIANYGSLENAYKERQKKTNKTLVARYGSVENYRKVQQELSKATVQEKYGVDNILLSDDIQEKCRQTLRNRHGVEYACMLPACRKSRQHDSRPNQQFAALLAESGIVIDAREFPLGRYIYDFKIGSLLIEINPSATHNVTWSPFWEGTGIAFDYHKLKSINAYKHGYRCVHVFDWTEVDEVIVNIINNNYEILYQDFGEPRAFIYDMRAKQLVDSLDTADGSCVKVYDDGIVLKEGSI